MNHRPAKTYSLSLPALTDVEAAADEVIRSIQAAGHVAFRVGGAVRDRLLGRAAADVDVATDAVPSRVRELFPRTFAVGESFGVVIVHASEGVDIEVATFRSESGYADGRHPAAVTFSDAATDAQRRDFTVNALFYDPHSEQVIDHVGGLADLRRGVIRAIGEPRQRFEEDHLRLLRAVRFAAELGFPLEESTQAAIQPLASSLQRISAERIAAELDKMLLGRDPRQAFLLLEKTGLLVQILPEIAAMRGVEQPPEFHPEGDVFEHTMIMLDRMKWRDRSLAWAVLLHDVGKPPTHEYSDGRHRFPRHAPIGAGMTMDILRRLKMPRRLVEQVKTAVKSHMDMVDIDKMRESKRRRVLARDTFPLELELHRIDCMASHGKLDLYVYMLDRICELRNEPVMPKPWVTGADLLAMGFDEGPQIGELLREAMEWQLNGEVESRDQALERLAGLDSAKKAKGKP